MSAAGRLWRRAPAWRLSLLSAIGLTALACMFPPTLPASLRSGGIGLRGGQGAGPAGGPGADKASFRPQRDASSDDDKGILDLPPPGPTRSGLIGFAGRGLPLPSGGWQTLATASLTVGVQRLLLDRVVDGHLTGLLLVTATGPFGGPAGPVGVPIACGNPTRLAGALVTEPPDQSPLLHECWSIVPVDMKAMAAGDDGGPMIARGLERLGDQGVAVPDRMLAVQFVRSTERGWQDVSVMVPDRGGTVTALSGWAARYQTLLHAGFDGRLQPADLTRAAIQTPS